MSQLIRYEVSDGIGTITIDRPAKRNAMTYAMLGEFLEAVAHAGQDTDARVLILTGSGGAFCAGTDLSDLSTVPGERREGRGRADQGERWWPIIECPKPVIAAVDGAAVGMGAEFTLQCDIRVASTRARFAWNFVHRGLVPDTGAGSWLLPRVVGVPTAARLLFSGEFLEAREALEIGYVSAVVEPEALLEAAQAQAQRFASGSPLSMKLIKELLYQGLAGGVDDHMQRHLSALKTCFRSEDHKEGVAAFLERREAKFQGR
jgi:enoyl-CoA hydratase/carnithine racemase